MILFGCIIQAQTITSNVTGSGLPLPSASVIVKGAGNGSSTDFDGNYTVNNVSLDATLVISYIGYVSVEVPVEGRSVINIDLEEDIRVFFVIKTALLLHFKNS